MKKAKKTGVHFLLLLFSLFFPPLQGTVLSAPYIFPLSNQSVIVLFDFWRKFGDISFPLESRQNERYFELSTRKRANQESEPQIPFVSQPFRSLDQLKTSRLTGYVYRIVSNLESGSIQEFRVMLAEDRDKYSSKIITSSVKIPFCGDGILDESVEDCEPLLDSSQFCTHECTFPPRAPHQNPHSAPNDSDQPTPTLVDQRGGGEFGEEIQVQRRISKEVQVFSEDTSYENLRGLFMDLKKASLRTGAHRSGREKLIIYLDLCNHFPATDCDVVRRIRNGVVFIIVMICCLILYYRTRARSLMSLVGIQEVSHKSDLLSEKTKSMNADLSRITLVVDNLTRELSKTKKRKSSNISASLGAPQIPATFVGNQPKSHFSNRDDLVEKCEREPIEKLATVQTAPTNAEKMEKMEKMDKEKKSETPSNRAPIVAPISVSKDERVKNKADESLAANSSSPIGSSQAFDVNLKKSKTKSNFFISALRKISFRRSRSMDFSSGNIDIDDFDTSVRPPDVECSGSFRNLILAQKMYPLSTSVASASASAASVSASLSFSPSSTFMAHSKFVPSHRPSSFFSYSDFPDRKSSC